MRLGVCIVPVSHFNNTIMMLRMRVRPTLFFPAHITCTHLTRDVSHIHSTPD